MLPYAFFKGEFVPLSGSQGGDHDHVLNYGTAARSVFQENQKGSIEVGKAADLVLIGGELLSTPGEEIPNLPVEMTLIDGEIVHQAG